MSYACRIDPQSARSWIERQVRHKRSVSIEDTVKGKTLTAMEKEFGDYLQIGIDRGDIYKHSDGLYYERTKTRKMVNSVEDETIGFTNSHVEPQQIERIQDISLRKIMFCCGGSLCWGRLL